MKKVRNEAALFKEALKVGGRYFEARGAGKFEATDHQDMKTRAIYLLLVKDKVIQPLASHDETLPNMRHKLALWMTKVLPPEHPLMTEHDS